MADIYISYAREDEADNPLVRDLCNTLHKQHRIQVRSDLKLRSGDDLNIFYSSLARAPILIVVISEAYFRSSNCMIKELMEAYLCDGLNSERLSQRTIFLVLETAFTFLSDPARSHDRDHPLKPIRDHWEKAITKAKEIDKRPDSDADLRKMEMLHAYALSDLVDVINSRKMVRGSKKIRANNFAEIRELLQEYIDKRIDQAPQILQGSKRQRLKGEIEWNVLMAKNSLGLPVAPSDPVPQPPSQSSPKISCLYLMVQLEETGEPNRLSLVPELQTHPPISANRTEWPTALRSAEEALKPHDNVSLAGGEGQSRPIGYCLKEWLEAVNRAASELAADPHQHLRVVLELFVPRNLLHYDFGTLIHVPATLETWPLGSSYPFMVRSLDRARDCAGLIERLHVLRNKSRKPGELHRMLLVSCCQGKSSPPDSTFSEPWRMDLYTITQEKDVGTCVVLPGLSSQTQHRDLLAILVDSWLPLVVFWPEDSAASGQAATGGSLMSAEARLTFVKKLLDASDLSDAPDFDTRGFSVPEVTINRFQLDQVAHQRKELRCSGARENDAISSHAIVLMDDPERWPRRLITSSG